MRTFPLSPIDINSAKWRKYVILAVHFSGSGVYRVTLNFKSVYKKRIFFQQHFKWTVLLQYCIKCFIRRFFFRMKLEWFCINYAVSTKMTKSFSHSFTTLLHFSPSSRVVLIDGYKRFPLYFLFVMAPRFTNRLRECQKSRNVK